MIFWAISIFIVLRKLKELAYMVLWKNPISKSSMENNTL